MTHIVSADFPQSHDGWDRMEQGLSRATQFWRRLHGAKGMPATLVTGGLAAVIVVANQVVDAWADGHLLLAWIAMWAVIFTLLALFSDAIRRWPRRLRSSFARRLRAYQAAEADAQTWAAALSDPRLMADLHHARLRAEVAALQRGEASPRWDRWAWGRRTHLYLLP